jgi:hypothetical protein
VAATQSIPAECPAETVTSSAPVKRQVSVADIIDASDTDKENDDEDKLPELQEASDDDDDEAEEAYQRTKALGDADCDVTCFFNYQFIFHN